MRTSDAVRKGVLGGSGDERSLFIPITKVDEERRLLYGRITEEKADKSGEIFDYDSSKPFYQRWSSDISDATGGKSKGNVRVMHTPKVGGKLTDLVFNDADKAIDCVAKILDDETWKLCLEGGFTGLSHGGRCVKAWQGDDGQYRYTLNPLEVSLVDNPALSSARFTLLKADGATERRPFRAVAANDFDRAFERAKADFLAKEAALGDDYTRRDRGDDVDRTIAPREGESFGASLVRRHQEHIAKLETDGKTPLPFSRWMAHDRTLHEEVHKRADSEQDAPRREAEQTRAVVLAEVEKSAAALMSKNATLTKGTAQSLVLQGDAVLSARYNAAFLGRAR